MDAGPLDTIAAQGSLMSSVPERLLPLITVRSTATGKAEAYCLCRSQGPRSAVAYAPRNALL